MQTSRVTTAAIAAQDETLNAEARQLLAQSAPDAVVEISRTALMDGDHIATVQDVTISLWHDVSGSPADASANRHAACTPDEYYRITDCGAAGGFVCDLPDGRSVVDLGDGSGQYLDISDGSVLDHI